jgi:uncharacterized protein (DUF2336 family)
MTSDAAALPATLGPIPNTVLIAELERAIENASIERRAAILTHITDLFIRGSAQFSEGEIELFDDLLTRLVLTVEYPARSALAEGLARVTTAPPNVTKLLAKDEESIVAHPILAHLQLEDPTLIAVARTKSQAHLLAISQRQLVNEAVSDVLVERGNTQVIRNLARNSGARFSQSGLASLINRSANDDILAVAIAERADVPHHFLTNLLGLASELVQTKFSADNVRREFSTFEPCFLFSSGEAALLAS